MIREKFPRSAWLIRTGTIALLLCGSLFLAGCALLGAAARAIPQHTKAAYANLHDAKVAVMVTADRAIRIDQPAITVDANRAITFMLQKAQKDNKPDELKNMSFPYKPESVVKYQREHPEIEFQPASEIAPQLGVDRLIYVEITQFSTRSETAMQLYRGSITANLRVIEVKNGKGKVAHEQNDIRVTFPKKSPSEGLLNANENDMYLGTINFFSIEVAQKFYEHDVEEEVK